MKPTVFASIALLAVALSVSQARAAPFPGISDFESDTDTYVPNSHPFDNESTISGSPPQLGTYFSSTAGVTSAGWQDYRTAGGVGLLEEVPSGYEGITSSQGNYHGVLYPSYGFQFLDGPFGRPAKQDDNVLNAGRYLGGGDNLGRMARWSFQMDLYLDPNGTTSPVSYEADWWWTNAIAKGADGTYATEIGFAARHVAPGTWNIHSTDSPAANPIVSLASGQWITLETRYDFTATKLAAVLNIWDHDHTSLLGSYALPAGSMFQNPNSADVQGGPRYSWFTSFPFFLNEHTWTSYDHLVVDNVGVGYAIGEPVPEVPEPSTLVLLVAGGAASLGLFRRRP